MPVLQTKSKVRPAAIIIMNTPRLQESVCAPCSNVRMMQVCETEREKKNSQMAAGGVGPVGRRGSGSVKNSSILPDGFQVDVASALGAADAPALALVPRAKTHGAAAGGHIVGITCLHIRRIKTVDGFRSGL